MTAPLITAGPVLLRPLCEHDEDLYLRLHASVGTMRHVSAVLDPDVARLRFDEACRLSASSEPAYWIWTVFLPDLTMAAGIVSLMARASRAEIGILLLPEWQSRGLGTAAVRALTEYAFTTLGVTRIESRQQAKNVGWERLMKRTGFETGRDAIISPAWVRWQRDLGGSVE